MQLPGSVLLIFLTLILIYLPGLMLANLLLPKEKQQNFAWLIAPFLGLSFDILVLQNLVYLNVSLSESFLSFLIFILILGIYQANLKVRAASTQKVAAQGLSLASMLEKNSPYLVLGCAFFVLLLHGVGYFWVGHKHYVGYGWIDQYNYTAMAQFFMDFPFRTGIDKVNEVPYIASIIEKINKERIGQSVFHGFAALAAQCNAKSVYGSISLLSPFLIFLSAWALASHLSYKGWKKFAVAFSSALMPGIAKIHLQGFLSNALAIPFLFIYPVIMGMVSEFRGFRTLFMASLIFAGVSAVYTEFVPIFLLLTFVPFIFRMTIVRMVSVIFLAVLMNPAFIKIAITRLTTDNLPNLHAGAYSFAFLAEGITRFWFEFNFQKYGTKIAAVTNFISLALAFLSFAGFIMLLRRKTEPLVLSLGLFIILPLLVFCSVVSYPYQYYKVLLSISPVVPFFLWEFVHEENKDGSVFFLTFTQAFKIFLIFLLFYYAILIPWVSSFSKTGKGSSVVSLSHNAENILKYETLEEISDQNFFLSGSHPFRMAWLTYHARKNHIWFMNDTIVDVPLQKFKKNPLFNFLGTLPDSLKVIQDGENYPKIEPIQAEYLLAVVIDNPQGIEKDSLGDFNWVGDSGLPLKLKIYSLYKTPQNVVLSFKAQAGPGHPGSHRVLEIAESNMSAKQYPFDFVKIIDHSLVISPGNNTIVLKTLYPQRARLINKNDPRSFLLRLSEMSLRVN